MTIRQKDTKENKRERERGVEENKKKKKKRRGRQTSKTNREICTNKTNNK